MRTRRQSRKTLSSDSSLSSIASAWGDDRPQVVVAVGDRRGYFKRDGDVDRVSRVPVTPSFELALSSARQAEELARDRLAAAAVVLPPDLARLLRERLEVLVRTQKRRHRSL